MGKLCKKVKNHCKALHLSFPLCRLADSTFLNTKLKGAYNQAVAPGITRPLHAHAWLVNRGCVVRSLFFHIRQGLKE